MSHFKPLPSFTFDLLCYLNRDQLDRFSIVCRAIKNLIDRYFRAKPYRVLDRLGICGGSYALFPTQKHSIDSQWPGEYSFAEMRPYLGPTVRIKETHIFITGESIYSPEHFAEMEFITHLWRDGDIYIWYAAGYGRLDNQPILDSPAILQCRKLLMHNANFSFKDYKTLYNVKFIEIQQKNEKYIDLWLQHWQEFLAQPGVKPIVAFNFLCHEIVDNLLDRISKAFSSAVSPNAFKVAFVLYYKSLTEFRETNKTSREILELKKGFPSEYSNKYFEAHDCYTLERSGI